MHILFQILAAQVLAPVVAMGIPSFDSIKVTKVSHYKSGQNKHIFDSPFGQKSWLTFDDNTERTVIEYDTKNGSGHIVIHHDDKKMFCSDGGLFCEPYGGSGEIGLMVVGLPGVIVSSPLILISNILFKTAEHINGINRYALAAYLKLRNQLDSKTQTLLKESIKNS